MLEWDDLRHLLAVVREGTLTGAADSLAVSRTTVGRRLAQAEERLGQRLFDRTPEGLVPTVAGRDLADTAVRMEEELLACEARILGRDAELRGALRVTTVDFVYEGFARVFASFVARYPGVELTVITGDQNLSLARREADVALRVGNQPAEHLVGRKVARLEFELAGARGLVDRIGLRAPLSAWPWIGWDERAGGRWLDTWLESHAPGAHIAMRVTSFAASHRSVRAGIGVAFLPRYLILEPELVGLGVELSEEVRQLWALTLPELASNRRVRAFLDHVHEALREG